MTKQGHNFLWKLDYVEPTLLASPIMALSGVLVMTCASARCSIDMYLFTVNNKYIILS